MEWLPPWESQHRAPQKGSEAEEVELMDIPVLVLQEPELPLDVPLFCNDCHLQKMYLRGLYCCSSRCVILEEETNCHPGNYDHSHYHSTIWTLEGAIYAAIQFDGSKRMVVTVAKVSRGEIITDTHRRVVKVGISLAVHTSVVDALLAGCIAIAK